MELRNLKKYVYKKDDSFFGNSLVGNSQVLQIKGKDGWTELPTEYEYIYLDK